MRSQWQKNERMTACYSRMTRANALVLMTSTATGLRVGDVLFLSSVQIRHGPLMGVVEHKTGRMTLIELPQQLHEALISLGNESWAFPGRDGTKPRTRQAVWKDLKKAAGGREAAKGLSPHSARKIYAVGLLEALGSLKAVQEQLGHEHIATTALYALSNVMGDSS